MRVRGECMNGLQIYMTEVRKYFFDLEERLQCNCNKTGLELLATKVDSSLPVDLKKLYTCYDGENETQYMGFFAGFTFLCLERVLAEYEMFQTVEDEMIAMGTRAIREEPICKLQWIPFAYDYGRAYLAMDLSPAQEGKIGQIITVDFDCNQSYLLADSLEELFHKMAQWFQEGILTVTSDQTDTTQLLITEVTGHLLNSIEELTAPLTRSDVPLIPVPNLFWQKHYTQELRQNEQGIVCVPLAALTKEKRLLIQDEYDLDCTFFSYMENLKELVIHSSVLTHISSIAKAPQLKSLIMVDCIVVGESLSALKEASQLKKISLNKMCGEGLDNLQSLKSLRSLSIRNVTQVTLENLAAFSNLQELSIEDMGLRDGSFIGKLHNLKKLNLHRHCMNNLDFLFCLPKLTSFRLMQKAQNEEGLLAVHDLVNLKEFEYPVKDVTIYKRHPNLEIVGMAADVEEEFDVFEGSKVCGFMICGAVTQQQVECIAQKMRQYIKLYSYGSCR